MVPKPPDNATNPLPGPPSKTSLAIICLRVCMSGTTVVRPKTSLSGTARSVARALVEEMESRGRLRS